MQEFDLTSEIFDDILVIKTEGYINNHGGERILKEYEQHCHGEVKSLMLDLEGSKVINSIGISYLIEIIEKMNSHNGKLFFTNLESSVEKTFTIMGLLQFAEIVDSVEMVNK